MVRPLRETFRASILLPPGPIPGHTAWEAERVRKVFMVLVVAAAATIAGVVLAPAASATTMSPVQYLLHPVLSRHRPVR